MLKTSVRYISKKENMSGSTNVSTMTVITFLIANIVSQKIEGANIFVGVGGNSGKSVGLSANSNQCNGGSWLNFCKTDCRKSPEYKSVCSFNTTHDDLDLDKGLVMSQMPQKIGKISLDSGDDRLLGNAKRPWGNSKYPWGNSKQPWNSQGNSEKDSDTSLDNSDDSEEDSEDSEENTNPWGNSKHPWGDSEHPWGNSKHPWGDSENPWGNSKHPWGDSENPWGNSKHPWGDSKNPWGYSDYPWGNSTYPWGNVAIAKVMNSVTYVFNGNVLKKSKVSNSSGGQNSPSDFPRNTENGLCYCTKLHG